MDLPERWQATTRHRASEGSSYYRHFRMGLFDARGRPKPAARRLRPWVERGVGICEWVYFQEYKRRTPTSSRSAAPMWACPSC
jgi:hypothetical protein